MSILERIPHTDISVALFSVLLVVLLVGSPVVADNKEAKLREAREVSAESLQILVRGDAAARREVAEAACGRFSILDPLADEDPESLQVVEQLQRYLQRENDDWIAMRLLDNIDCHRQRLLRPLFLDALASASPNLRWRAFRWFTRVEEPEAVSLLEKMWSEETRIWARRDLIKALSRNHSSRFVEEFLDLSESEDPELTSAAIGALRSLGDERAIPQLARLARDSEDWRRMEAAEALGAWPQSSEALDSLLEASNAEETEVRACALRSLSRLEKPAGMLRVLATALSDPNDEVRRAGVESLNSSPWHEVVDHLLRDAPEQVSADRTELEDLFRGIMNSLSASEKEPATVAPTSGGDDRESRCTYHRDVGLTPDNPASMRASPPSGRSSSRCFIYPGVTGDPAILWRVPRGSLLSVDDHFEGPERAWVRVDGSMTPNPCWLPASDVVPTPEEGPPKEEEGILRRDFDAPAAEEWNPLFVEMTQGGMVEIIEPGEEIIGVTVRLQMGNLKDETFLARAVRSSEGLLALNIFWMFEEAYTRVCDYPSMLSLAAELAFPVTHCSNSPATAEDPTPESDPSLDSPSDHE